MEDDDSAMRKLIVSALNECHDAELLDLVYKLLVYETVEQ